MGIIVPNLKKQYKIKFACSWADSKSITDRVMLNWGKPPENITLVNNDDFDYLISFNDSKERLSVAPEKDVVFTMEPSWSPNLLEDYDNCKAVFTSSDKYTGKNVVKGFPLMFHHDSGGFNNISSEKTPTDYIEDQSFKKDKKISFIIANHGTTSGLKHNENSLYKLRENILVKILKSDLDIHIFGQGWNIEDSRYKGPVRLKSEALKDYKYSIAIENSRENFYLSEKLFDCYLNNCVPIYYGCNRVSDFFPDNSFINFDPYDSNLISTLKNISSMPVHYYQTFILQAKQDYFVKYNIFNYINSFLDE